VVCGGVCGVCLWYGVCGMVCVVQYGVIVCTACGYNVGGEQVRVVTGVVQAGYNVVPKFVLVRVTAVRDCRTNVTSSRQSQWRCE
jgi:hypothetical protein